MMLLTLDKHRLQVSTNGVGLVPSYQTHEITNLSHASFKHSQHGFCACPVPTPIFIQVVSASIQPEPHFDDRGIVCFVFFCELQGELELCCGAAMPKFGLAWTETGQFSATIAAYKPVFGKRVPDVGPLNLRIVPYLTFEFHGLHVSYGSVVGGFSFLPCLGPGSRKSQAREGPQDLEETFEAAGPPDDFEYLWNHQSIA